MKNNLRELCKKIKINQAQIARDLSLTPAAINLWFQNVNQPAVEDVFRLCKFLKCSIIEIYPQFLEVEILN